MRASCILPLREPINGGGRQFLANMFTLRYNFDFNRCCWLATTPGICALLRARAISFRPWPRVLAMHFQPPYRQTSAPESGLASGEFE